MSLQTNIKIMFLSLLLALLGFMAVVQPARAEPVELLLNRWALGVDDLPGCPGSLNGWQFNQYVSLSRCYKNPAPPAGQTQGGAAFKNGPVSGGGAPGEVATIWQDIDAAARGLPVAAEYQMTFQTLFVSVGGQYAHFDLYGSQNGTDYEFITRLVDWPAHTPCGQAYWAVYCGTAVVPYYPYYRLQVDSVFTQQLGLKWTGLSLLAEPVEQAATAGSGAR